MSKQEEAGLILKLYDLRREDVMRKARSWMAMEFNPQSIDDFDKAIFGEHSAYYRMVVSYWEMACSFVTNGAIEAQLFNDANGEHVFFFAKLQPYINELREKFASPGAYQHLEKVVMAIPDIEARFEVIRANMKRMAARRAHEADQSLRV